MKKKHTKSNRNKNTMVLWLSLILLAIVIEALYVMKFEAQKSLQSNSLEQQVSGASDGK